MRKITMGVLAAGLLSGTAVQAQTLGAVEQRIGRLEKAVEKLENRKPKTQPAAEPKVAPPAPAMAAVPIVMELDGRLQSLERQVSGLVASDEQRQRAVKAGAEQFALLRTDVEQRLQSIEEQLAKLVQAQSTPAPVAPPQKVLTADDRYVEALGFIERQEWTKAEFAFDTFIAANAGHPKLPDARFWLGRAFEEQGKKAQAAQVYLELFEKYPQASFAIDNLFALARTLVELGPENHEQACAIYDQIDVNFKNKINVDQRNKILDQRLKLSCPA